MALHIAATGTYGICQVPAIHSNFAVVLLGFFQCVAASDSQWMNTGEAENEAMFKDENNKKKSGKNMIIIQKKCAAEAACKDQGKMILYYSVRYKAHTDPAHSDL